MKGEIRSTYIKDEQELVQFIDAYLVKDNENRYRIKRGMKDVRLCIMLAVRGKEKEEADLVKYTTEIWRCVPEIILCEIKENKSVWIRIREEWDYEIFFQEFVDGGQIKREWLRSKFCFKIFFGEGINKQSVDEQRIFYYYLIANKYGKYRFSLDVFMQKEESDSSKWETSNYHRICVFSTLQVVEEGIKGNISYGEYKRRICAKSLKYIGKIFPVLTITEEHLRVLECPIDRELWEKIQKSEDLFMEKSVQSQKIGFEEILIALCGRYLFCNDEGGKVLQDVRKKAFQSPDFFDLIEGIPMLALLIFAEFDYYSRVEMVEEYRNRCGGKNIRLSDLLEDCQSEQQYEAYCVHLNMVKEGMNIKSLLTRCAPYDTLRSYKMISKEMTESEVKRKNGERELYQIYELHSQLVTEVYAAVSVAEGLLQLLDNVVIHAGRGVMSMRIHSMDDKTVLKMRYPYYFFLRENVAQARYFLEVRISDLSGNSIAETFKSKYVDFGNTLEESQRKVLKEFSLKSFFEPQEEEREIWDAFYGQSQNVVNHYGLQIFESIIRSRDGYFAVTSKDEMYCSEKTGDEERLIRSPGTSYVILLPLDNRISEDKNIYDSMLAYDTCEYLSSRRKKKLYKFDFSYMMPPDNRKKGEFYERVSKRLENVENGDWIYAVDVEKVVYLEGVVKGVMLYVFKGKEQNIEKQMTIAFINCKAYQIVEIVRLISLSYDKAGKNNKMRGVQIYIRGKNIGEEIIFFGDTLNEIGNNIMKMACMRGTLYDNFQAVDTLLKRR